MLTSKKRDRIIFPFQPLNITNRYFTGVFGVVCFIQVSKLLLFSVVAVGVYGLQKREGEDAAVS